ncbi:MAG: sigma-70 family RNA polymerase sigma factor [Cytophagales bacterium]|nr:MAG: sigma-70 family RNA polymerase sigma factor [Cytophagales bacterium]
MKDADIVSISDTDLWQKFKNGEDAAFGLIFHTHYKAIFNYGLKFNSNSELVEDCIQELFLELWKNKNSISQIDNIKPYLLKSIRRKIIKQSNKNSKLRKLFNNVLPKEYEFEVIFSPEYQLIHSQISEEKVKKLQTMLDSLPPRQKEVLYLLFYQDMSYEEISQIMSMNYQSARNLVHRAIKLLRDNSLLDTLIIYFIFLKNFPS